MRWLGIDGGGTKTCFELYDEEMRPVRSLRLPTCHPGQVGYEGMRAVLAEGIMACTAGEAGPIGIGFGLAGYGQDPAVRARMGSVVREVAAGRPFELMSDVRAAWASSHGARDGAVVICGTGSIAYAVGGERERRAGGWGYRVGDEGSGWWMGRELLRLFSRQADGRDGRGPLFDTVMEGLGFERPYDVIAYANEELRGDRAKTASLARVLCRAAAAGDAYALGVYERAAAELADAVRAACAGLFDDASGPVPVGYASGVFEGAGALLIDPLRRALPDGYELREPRFDLTIGPCLLLRRRIEDAHVRACNDRIGR